MLKTDCGLHISDQDPRFVDDKTEQRVSMCSAIPASILLKSILDRCRPDMNPVFYLNLYWTVIVPTGIQYSS